MRYAEKVKKDPAKSLIYLPRGLRRVAAFCLAITALLLMLTVLVLAGGVLL
jgi:hypothetical protein